MTIFYLMVDYCSVNLAWANELATVKFLLAFLWISVWILWGYRRGCVYVPSKRSKKNLSIVDYIQVWYLKSRVNICQIIVNIWMNRRDSSVSTFSIMYIFLIAQYIVNTEWLWIRMKLWALKTWPRCAWSCSDVDEPRVSHTEWSKSEREK